MFIFACNSHSRVSREYLINSCRIQHPYNTRRWIHRLWIKYAPESCSPGAKRVTKSIGCKNSLYSLADTPALRNSSLAVIASYLAYVSSSWKIHLTFCKYITQADTNFVGKQRSGKPRRELDWIGSYLETGALHRIPMHCTSGSPKPAQIITMTSILCKNCAGRYSSWKF